MTIEALEPRCHEPPPGWSAEVFAAVTDALAAALVASWRRAQQSAALQTSDTAPGPGR